MTVGMMNVRHSDSALGQNCHSERVRVSEGVVEAASTQSDNGSVSVYFH